MSTLEKTFFKRLFYVSLVKSIAGRWSANNRARGLAKFQILIRYMKGISLICPKEPSPHTHTS